MMAMQGIILYGPPAAGKTTVTNVLLANNKHFKLYQRLKCGPVKKPEYRMVSGETLEELRAAGEVVYENHQYDSTYVIERAGMIRLARTDIPIVHVGQSAAIHALVNGIPRIDWSVVELWCPREITAARLFTRDPDDVARRMSVYENTPHLSNVPLRIDTSKFSPQQVAARIAASVSGPGYITDTTSTDGCPKAHRCFACGLNWQPDQLEVITVELEYGTACATICEACLDSEIVPDFRMDGERRAVELHSSHLGMTPTSQPIP